MKKEEEKKDVTDCRSRKRKRRVLRNSRRKRKVMKSSRMKNKMLVMEENKGKENIGRVRISA